MDQLKKILQRSRTHLQPLSFPQTFTFWGAWLKKKRKMAGLVLLGLLLVAIALSRQRLITLQGERMGGTHYQIQYFDRWGRNYQKEIDTLLSKIYQTFSLALPNSALTQFNAHDCTEFRSDSPYLYPLFAKSKEMYRNTSGAFDPTILPLVDGWAGRLANIKHPNEEQVNLLRNYVGLDYVVANEQRLKKLKEGVRLDFTAILKGYAADEVVALLRSHGVQKMQVTLGEQAMVAYGKLKSHTSWKLHTNQNIATWLAPQQELTLDVADKAVAISSKRKDEPTSQGYIIDTTTGYPANHTLLAAIVVAEDCGAADAYATAMMARGLDFAKTLLANREDLDALLIYEDEEKTAAFYTSDGLCMEKTESAIRLKFIEKTAPVE